MSYFEFLPEEIFIPIVSKLPLDDIINLIMVVDLNDNFFRFLYSVNFPSIFEFVKDFFPLDPNISWTNHYFQIFKMNRLFKYYILSLDPEHGIPTIDPFNERLLNQGSEYVNETDQYVNKILLHHKSLVTGPSMCYLDFDYYIIKTLYIAKNNIRDNINNNLFKLLMYPFFEYSKIYVDNILSYIMDPIYKLDAIRPVRITLIRKSDRCQTLDIYRLSFLRLSDINFIISNDNIQVYDKYRSDGLWIKYLIIYFPRTIKYI